MHLVDGLRNALFSFEQNGYIIICIVYIIAGLKLKSAKVNIVASA